MTSSPIHTSVTAPAYFIHQSAPDVISLTSNCIKERQQRLRPLDGDEPDDKDTKGELVSAQSWRRATPWETGLGMYASWIITGLRFYAQTLTIDRPHHHPNLAARKRYLMWSRPHPRFKPHPCFPVPSLKVLRRLRIRSLR